MIYAKFKKETGSSQMIWAYDLSHLVFQLDKAFVDVEFISAKRFFTNASFLTIKDFFHNA